ncbi:VOC family protein [Ligilactobacillus sp. WILCCON 0076]|uniref:VOC family protein n=1 Tax=Ligilactobacillus ubinensis TaxID=2876789 RepID=A0A9X2FL74_9LACO|nr:VOC family protein [Ligilactobacillus ubinensis]MCP0887259.1 VOC family protein [Ligilactobacillus ubinensis]
MKVKRIDNTVLTVTNLERATRFYHEVFDMPLLDNTDTTQTLRCGHQLLKLQKKDTNFSASTIVNTTLDNVDLCILVNDKATDILNHLKSYFIDIVSGPISQADSVGTITSIFIRDYDSNLIKITTYIK